MRRRGRPSCRKAIGSSATTRASKRTRKVQSPVKVPSTLSSTSHRSASPCSSGRLPGGTASTMRSCASEIQISQGASPAYLSGALARSTSTPSFSPISPTADEKPPAPQSVMAVYSPRSRASSITSISPFSVIASPICTALPVVSAVSCVSSAEEKVAPWMPSRPVRPPSATTRSPACAARGCRPIGQQPDAAAEDQRVAQVALVVEDRAVDRRDAQLVAVVADPRHHPAGNPLRMQHPVGQLRVGIVLRAKAEHVGVGDRPRRHADDVADHAAHAGVGAAKRLERRRVVVRLDLEGQVIVVVKGDDAGVVHKGRAQPRRPQLLGRRGQILVDQPVDHLLLPHIARPHPARRSRSAP